MAQSNGSHVPTNAHLQRMSLEFGAAEERPGQFLSPTTGISASTTPAYSLSDAGSSATASGNFLFQQFVSRTSVDSLFISATRDRTNGHSLDARGPTQSGSPAFSVDSIKSPVNGTHGGPGFEAKQPEVQPDEDDVSTDDAVSDAASDKPATRRRRTRRRGKRKKGNKRPPPPDYDASMLHGPMVVSTPSPPPMQLLSCPAPGVLQMPAAAGGGPVMQLSGGLSSSSLATLQPMPPAQPMPTQQQQQQQFVGNQLPVTAQFVHQPVAAGPMMQAPLLVSVVPVQSQAQMSLPQHVTPLAQQPYHGMFQQAMGQQMLPIQQGASHPPSWQMPAQSPNAGQPGYYHIK